MVGEKHEDVAVVIMAGGAGTRFWPLSTRVRPKQFLKLLGERSLLQESYARARLLAHPERILVLTNQDFVPLVCAQLPELAPENVVGEPVRRDTAAAVCLAALICRRRFGNPVMVVLTADHRIEPDDGFRRAVLSAAEGAALDVVLYTIGVAPTFPATGYGYLQSGSPVKDDGGVVHYDLLHIREKPDLETASRYVRSGRYWWNSGMFIWQVDTILGELERHLSGHLRLLSPVVDAEEADDWGRRLHEAFEALPAISIDFAVMEKARSVRMVAATFEWSDLGGWLALEEFLALDAKGNRHNARLAALDAGHNLVFSEDPEELVALVGVRDLVVVRAGTKTLVMERGEAEAIKELVRELERSGQREDI